MTTFDDAIVVITGAGSGIGRALAHEVVRRGARVVLAGRRAGPLQTTLETAPRRNRCEAVPVDVTQPEQVDHLVGEVLRRHGRIDVFVNNAGVGLAGELDAVTAEDWQHVLGANLHGVIHGVAAVYPHMIRQGHGHIVNVGSAAGLLPRPGMAPYATAKHAVTGLTLALQVEARTHGIVVSLAAPGGIDTEMLDTTVYRGVDGERVRRLARGRLMSATRCASILADGVEAERAVIVVTAAARAEWLLYRVSPRLALALARLRLSALRHLNGDD